MGRPRRLEVRGGIYHVYARGNRGAGVFEGKSERHWYLGDVERITKEHRARVYAFCLMPNHTHLCFQTDAELGGLSLIMQRINQAHAKRFNLARNVRGRLNESRFGAQYVDDAEYLRFLVRYIHRNPLRKGFVEAMDEWQFSSHQAYLGRGFPWVDTAPVLSLLGGRAKYLEWMGAEPDVAMDELFEPDETGRRLPELPRWPPARRRTAPDDPGADRVAVAAEIWARARGLSYQAIASNRRGKELTQSRKSLARELRGLGFTLPEIARATGCGRSTVAAWLAEGKGGSPSGARHQLDGAEGPSGAWHQLDGC